MDRHPVALIVVWTLVGCYGLVRLIMDIITLAERLAP